MTDRWWPFTLLLDYQPDRLEPGSMTLSNLFARTFAFYFSFYFEERNTRGQPEE